MAVDDSKYDAGNLKSYDVLKMPCENHEDIKYSFIIIHSLVAIARAIDWNIDE